MKKLCINIFILFIVFLSSFNHLDAAEILQVSSSSIILIGDNNRTYTVKIACTEISPDLEERAVEWLREKLPRHTKVNLRPKSSVDGILVAKIIPFNSNTDITEEYIKEGFATDIC